MATRRRNARFVWTFALGLGCGWGGVSFAQDLDLAEVERRALAGAPRLVALRERLAALEARERVAGLWSDPMLEVEAMDLLPSGGRPVEGRLLVRQPLPPAGRRVAERRVAADARALAAAELAVEERAVVAEVRLGWAEVWGAQAERRLLEEAHPLIEMVVESATARVAGGGERTGAVLDERVALRRHEIEQEEVDARWLAAQSRLAEVAGFPDGGAFPRVPPLVELPLPEFELAAAATASPRVAAAARRVDQVRAELELVRVERRPATSVGVGVRTIEGDGTELTLAGGVELPFFRRRRVAGRVEAAEHEVAAATAEVERERLAVRGELERLSLQRISVERQLERLRQGLLIEAGASFEAARAALLDGSGTAADASERLAVWIESKFDESQLVAQRFAIRAEIVALLPDESVVANEPAGEKP